MLLLIGWFIVSAFVAGWLSPALGLLMARDLWNPAPIVGAFVVVFCVLFFGGSWLFGLV